MSPKFLHLSDYSRSPQYQYYSSNIKDHLEGHVKEFYPDFTEFISKVVEHKILVDKTHDIIFFPGSCYAVVNMKKFKINTFVCLKKGIGHMLFGYVVNYMRDIMYSTVGSIPKGIELHVSDDNHDSFKPLLRRHKFELTEVKNGLYREGVNEHFYFRSFIHDLNKESSKWV